MTHDCCVTCRLRFAHPADELAPCPLCGTEIVTLTAERAMGFRLHRADAPETLVAAVALRVPGDGPRGRNLIGDGA